MSRFHESHDDGSDVGPGRSAGRPAGGEIEFDLTESADQAKGPVNCGAAQAVSACRVGYKLLVSPDLPGNGGSFRPMTVRVRTAPPEIVVNRGRPDERRLLKCNGVPLKKGDTVLCLTGGGGGFGAPEERAEDAVHADVADRHVTPRAAATAHGHPA